MLRTPIEARRLAALLGAAVVVAAATAAASAAVPAVRFSSFPRQVIQGNVASVAVTVRQRSAVCGISVRYSDGQRQAGLGSARAGSGVVRWRWAVPRTVDAGPALVRVSCGRAGSASARLTVVGSRIPAKIVVQRQGFSQRPDQSGNGSSVSYGMILKNTSPDEDALDLSVLVNMLDAQNHVQGSVSSTVPLVAAAQDYNLGGYLQFSDNTTPIVRLEIVVQVRGRAAKAARAPVGLDNVSTYSSPFDKGWVSGIQGELVNLHPSMVMASAKLSAIILDAEGNILGGGVGYSSTALPSGTRVLFKITSGMRSVEASRAATVLLTVEPLYRPPS